MDSKHGTKRKINENRPKIEFLDVDISNVECFATLFVYQLNELSGGIPGLDSKHSTRTQMSEVFGLIPKYLKVAGHLSHFSSEFHKILTLTLKRVWHNPPFSINCALFLPYFFISLIFKHYHTQNGRGAKILKTKYSYFGQAE